MLRTFVFHVGVQEKLGILNGGVVWAVYSYEAHNPDELSFQEGDKLVVLRKGDEWEREWWWSRLQDREGYVPRNLLGVSHFFSCTLYINIIIYFFINIINKNDSNGN